MSETSKNPSTADNQQEIPWIIRNQQLIKDIEAMRAQLAVSERHNADEISDLLDQLHDAALGIDVLTSSQGEEHINELINKINNRLSPFCDYLP